jgi:hypothetical protein
MDLELLINRLLVLQRRMETWSQAEQEDFSTVTDAELAIRQYQDKLDAEHAHDVFGF